jgi:hypothetical protein
MPAADLTRVSRVKAPEYQRDAGGNELEIALTSAIFYLLFANNEYQML